MRDITDKHYCKDKHIIKDKSNCMHLNKLLDNVALTVALEYSI